MSRYCLDTSAYSFFRRGDPAVVALMDSAEWIGISPIVLGELWVGFLHGTRLDRDLAELQELLAHPAVEEVVVSRNTSRVFAEITLDLKRRGNPIPINDIWIAATAATAGATVLTYDEHFQAISRVGSIVLPRPVA